MISTIDRDDELLVIEVPHQGAPSATSFADEQAFEEWLVDHYASKGEYSDWLREQHNVANDDDSTTLQALEDDPKNMRAFWAHDLHSTYVFLDRVEAATTLRRFHECPPSKLPHGATGIVSAIRGWLQPAFETLEELRAEMQTQPDSLLLSEDCEDWPTFGGEMPAEAAIVSVWSWDEERVLIGEGDNLAIITREELRAEYGSN